MSKNDGSRPSSGHARKSPGKQPGRTDFRIRRTRERLGAALIALLQDKSMDEVTIRGVLVRADVGRSTFYVHYRDKDDLLLSQLEDGLEMWSNILSTNREKSRRVAAVTEYFGHVGSARKLYRSLVAAGRIQIYFDLAHGYFARGISRRLKEMGIAMPAKPGLDPHSHALAGNLVALLRWWLDHGAPEPPEDMDQLFHRMLWKGLSSP